jgi:hypothetical protein
MQLGVRLSGLLSVALSLLLVHVAAAPASAGMREYNVAVGPSVQTTCQAEQGGPWPIASTVVNGQVRGMVCFGQYGDHLWAQDRRHDGRSVGLIWVVGNRAGVCRHKAGDTRWRRCNKDFPEHRKIKYRAGLCNETAQRSCKLRKHYRFKSDWITWSTT